MITRRQLDEFIARHQLPATFQRLTVRQYRKLECWLAGKCQGKKPFLLGINGAQGTGKSTLADYLKLVLEENESWHVAVLSLDDFYLTKTERRKLSEDIHPLLLTRGVPGTHDLPLLSTRIEQLINLPDGEKLPLPRFDKASDDRAPMETWPIVTGPIDVVILEGWCVNSKPQPVKSLSKPINRLERDRDPDGKWRQYVNRQLAGGYADLFEKLDALIYLRAPGFDAVYRWRLEQEEKLAAKSPEDRQGIMNSTQIAEFLQYFERLTRSNFDSIPEIADVILDLDQHHDCVRSLYAS